MENRNINNSYHGIHDVFYELVKIKSDSGTALERDVEDYIYNWIRNLEYFKDNQDKFGSYALKGDFLHRSVVWGLIKGQGKETIVLMHHHDVVDSLDYGQLSEHAYSPNNLEKFLKKLELPEDAQRDLNSGEWIFGRGTADMKAGAAIQLNLLEKYSRMESLNGNILLVSVPDEESLSAGMREAVSLLNELKDKFDLDYKLLINSEPHEREVVNEGIVYEGSVGKIMPVIYVRGKKTHVKDIFKGLNPINIMSEIVRRTELNLDFCDIVEGEVSPPPTWLNFRDKKEVYDVSIPESVGGYFSILTLKKTPKEIITQLKAICEDAFDAVLKNMESKYNELNKRLNQEDKGISISVKVKTFSQIFDEALKINGDAFIKDYRETLDKVRGDIQSNKINMPESTFIIIKKVLEYVSDLSPVVVIALSPPYYPHVTNTDIKQLPRTISNISNMINNYTQERFNEKYVRQKYFMGISDMSYVALTNSQDVIPYIEPNMPLWGDSYSIPFEEMKAISMAAINVGPWGKDLHKITERVFERDLFERTPILTEYIVNLVLNHKD